MVNTAHYSTVHSGMILFWINGRKEEETEEENKGWWGGIKGGMGGVGEGYVKRRKNADRDTKMKMLS